MEQFKRVYCSETGPALYSEEYKMIGFLVKKTGDEAILDLIDSLEEDLIYCDIKKCHIATEEEINSVTEGKGLNNIAFATPSKILNN